MTLHELERQTGPAPALIRHGQRFLLGSLNQEAHDAWVEAIARALQTHPGLDEALKSICQVYLAECEKEDEWWADELRLRPERVRPPSRL